MIRKPKYNRMIILNDLHAPFYDRDAFKAVLSFSKWYKPEYIILNGDITDFYQISKFDKDPKRINEFQDDVDCTIDLLTQIRKANPNAGIIYNEGNHEERLIKFKWNIPQVNSLRCMEFENLMNLKELKIQYEQSHTPFKKTIIKHGDIVRKESCYTARGEFDKVGISGVSGHTHRLGVYFKTKLSGEYMWLENGCLCDLKPEYIKGTPNWQHGFSIGYYKSSSNRFNLDQIQIIHGKAMYGGYEFY
jgi:predicted phosphodiesterase